MPETIEAPVEIHSYEVSDIKRSGYYEVFLDGVRINRDGHSGNHTNENEAEQTIFWYLKHAKPDADPLNFRIKKPDTVFEVDKVSIIIQSPAGGNAVAGDVEPPLAPAS